MARSGSVDFGEVSYKTTEFDLAKLGEASEPIKIRKTDGSSSIDDYRGMVRGVFFKTSSGDYYRTYLLIGSVNPTEKWKASESIRIKGTDIEDTDVSPLSGKIVISDKIEVGKGIRYLVEDKSNKSISVEKTTSPITEIVVTSGYFASREKKCIMNTEYLDKYQDGLLRR